MPARRLLPTLLAVLAIAPVAGAAVPTRPVLARHPAATTFITSATFTWRPARPGTRCRLDASRWLPCRSPRAYSRLRPGRHRFLVRVGPAGRITSFGWTVRSRPGVRVPALPVVATPSAPAAAPGPAPPPAPPPAPTRLADHVILVDWDGFAPSLLQRGYDTPTLNALSARGSLSLDAQSTFTSFSNPARASMSTGAYPETHGNVAWTWDSATNTVLGQTRRLDAESIAEALARDPAGLTEASVQWYMVQDHGVAYGDASHLYVQPGGTWGNRVDTAIKIIDRQPVSSNGTMVTVPRIPDFLAVYSSDPDELEHAQGTDGPDIQAMVEQHDHDLGRLVQATKDAGIYDRTTFILTADHGMSNWTKTALQTLKDAVAGTGFSSEVLYAGGHAASATEVIVDPAVRVAYLHLRGAAATPDGRQKVRDALAARPEFTDVLGPAELSALHAGPDLGDLVVEAKPPWSFAMADVASGEKGVHGSQAELGVPLLLSGAGIGGTPPSGPGLVDVAPTIAALLHAPCPANAQGRALTEAFSAPAACT
jgi:Type I phosphodiesterase / nucleotide pyrophosphatase